VFGEIKGDGSRALKPALAIWIETGECLLKKVVLIRGTTDIVSDCQKIRNRLPAVAHCISALMTILPHIHQTPLHQLVSCEVGKITVYRSGDLERDDVGRTFICIYVSGQERENIIAAYRCLSLGRVYLDHHSQVVLSLCFFDHLQHIASDFGIQNMSFWRTDILCSYIS
jgi:hypothetical protein